MAAAGLLVEPADQGRAGPVPGRRQPRAVRQLVTDAKEEQRDTLSRLEAENHGAHAPIITRSGRDRAAWKGDVRGTDTDAGCGE